MAQALACSWFLFAFAGSAAACSIYGPELLSASLEGQAGSAFTAGASGDIQQVAGASAVGGLQQVAGASAGGTAGNEARGGSGSLAPEAGATAPTKPYLSAELGEQPASVSLTTSGSLDWAHWGLQDSSDYNHKAAVTSQLLDFKPLGGKAAEAFLDGPTTFSWSDGAPTASGSSGHGIAWVGLHEGFQLAVPAAPEPRRLHLYIGVYAGTGRIRAALSDPRATTRVDAPVVSAQQNWVLQVVSLEYGGCGEPATTLDITLHVEAMVAPSAAVAVTALTIDQP